MQTRPHSLVESFYSFPSIILTSIDCHKSYSYFTRIVNPCKSPPCFKNWHEACNQGSLWWNLDGQCCSAHTTWGAEPLEAGLTELISKVHSQRMSKNPWVRSQSFSFELLMTFVDAFQQVLLDRQKDNRMQTIGKSHGKAQCPRQLWTSASHAKVFPEISRESEIHRNSR